MQFKSLALLGLATTVLAAHAPAHHEHAKREDSNSSSSIDVNSVASVLITALPQSLLSIAATNTAAVSSIVASEFSAGETPSWFSGLPSDIQTYLLGTEKATASPPIATGNSTINGTLTAFNSTATSTATSTGTKSSSSLDVLTTASSPSTSKGSAGASSSSSGLAAVPTAVIGSGLLGALGVVGMLAL